MQKLIINSEDLSCKKKKNLEKQHLMKNINP